MDALAGTLAAAVGMFAGTNIDDLLVLAVLFLSGRATGAPRPWQIWAGQSIGFAVLVALSLLAALGLAVVPDAWVGLLGLVPFTLGAYGLLRAIRTHGTAAVRVSAVPAGGLWSVAMLTIGNGADNLAVYPPVFRTVGAGSVALTIVVFGAGVAVWCLAGSWLGSHKKVIALIERYGHWIVPSVFMAIGVIIFVTSGMLGAVL